MSRHVTKLSSTSDSGDVEMLKRLGNARCTDAGGDAGGSLPHVFSLAFPGTRPFAKLHLVLSRLRPTTPVTKKERGKRFNTESIYRRH